jgi:hypothetical protein
MLNLNDAHTEATGIGVARRRGSTTQTIPSMCPHRGRTDAQVPSAVLGALSEWMERAVLPAPISLTGRPRAGVLQHPHRGLGDLHLRRAVTATNCARLLEQPQLLAQRRFFAAHDGCQRFGVDPGGDERRPRRPGWRASRRCTSLRLLRLLLRRHDNWRNHHPRRGFPYVGVLLFPDPPSGLWLTRAGAATIDPARRDSAARRMANRTGNTASKTALKAMDRGLQR